MPEDIFGNEIEEQEPANIPEEEKKQTEVEGLQWQIDRLKDQMRTVDTDTNTDTDTDTNTDTGMKFGILQGYSATNFSADALPPVTLSACLWLSGKKLSYTEASLNVENEISIVKDACSATGNLSSRIVNQTTSFAFNPYLQDDTTADTWDKFNNNDDVSVFGYAYNSSATAGEFSEVVAYWLPQAKIIASPVADVDGITAEPVEIKAHRSLGSDSVFLGFI